MLKGVLGCVAAALLWTQAAAASDNWLPHPDGATWTYAWSDSAYAPVSTLEKVTVKSQKGTSFTLAWTTDGLGNPDGAVSSAGAASFQETNAGLVNVDWSSTPPPPEFPILCAQATGCGNALSSTLYNLIWGSRQPLLAEPLVKGATWTSTGGAANDVSSVSVYRGREKVVVPAFPQGVVRIEFDHSGGANAPVMIAELQSTTQAPLPAVTDDDFFPLAKDSTLAFRWTNTKHLKTPETDRFVVDAVVNGTARLKLQSATGPIKAVGTYGFSKRLDGLTNLWGTTTSSASVTFPPLGPTGVPASQRNRFVTALDLLTFGMNPILTALPAVGDQWSSSRSSDDFRTYAVDGQTRITGMQTVHVPAGTFRALVVRSTLTQRGYTFGSGTRTCWFAAGKGLVKLVFAHRDGSVSTVVRLK